MGPGLATLEKTREDLFLLLTVMQLVLLSLAFLISIFMSHKIAGPLYKLNRFFREARDGNIQQKLSFRRKDYFQELVPTYNEMMDSVRARFEKKDAGIQLAIQSLEKILATSGSHSQSEIQQVLVKLRESQK
jgi:nitrogen fixation/metabolism regulation signal transduction histidine kinase